MSDDIIPITVTILDRDYHVACPPGEETALLASAAQLDRRMQEIKSAGKVVGTDRLAVMAALNIINEMSKLKSAPPALDHLSTKLAQLHAKVDQQLDMFE